MGHGGDIDDGEALRRARVALNLSQQGMRTLYDGATRSAISRWEAGEFRPPIGYVQAVIARTTDPVSVARLEQVACQDRTPSPEHDPDRAIRLAAFLGHDVLREGVHLVLPVFQYSEAAQQALEHLGEGQRIYEKPLARDARRRVDIVQPVAANDLRALCAVAQLLSSPRIGIHPITDAEAVARQGRFPTISFGLLSNDLTHLYERLWRNRGLEPVFTTGADSDGRSFVRLPDGSEYGYEDDCFGLVTRVTPDRAHPGRRWIFCAGLGPTGTEAAAAHLVDSWAQMAQVAGDADFVTLVRCESGHPAVAHSNAEDTMTV